MKKKIVIAAVFVLVYGITSAWAWTGGAFSNTSSNQTITASGNGTSGWKPASAAITENGSEIKQPYVIPGSTIHGGIGGTYSISEQFGKVWTPNNQGREFKDFSGDNWKSYGTNLGPIVDAKLYESVTVNVNAIAGGEKIVVQLIPDQETVGTGMEVGLSPKSAPLNKGDNIITIPLADFGSYKGIPIAVQGIKHVAVHYGQTYFSYGLNADNKADIEINSFQFNPKN